MGERITNKNTKNNIVICQNFLEIEEKLILGTKVNLITVEQLHKIIKLIIQRNLKGVISNVNVYALNLVYQHDWLREFINSSAVVFCDGAGVILGAKLLGFSIPERITYADWMWQLGAFAEENGFSLFFLGAKEGVAEKAADKLKDRFPKIKIMGTHHGFFAKTQRSVENDLVINMINDIEPNILIVGFGMPRQERWLMENWDKINANIALTGGAAFDYVSGELKRGPKWLTDNGFEWLARMIIEPKRLWRRYVIGNPIFIVRVLMQRFGLLNVKPKR